MTDFETTTIGTRNLVDQQAAEIERLSAQNTALKQLCLEQFDSLCDRGSADQYSERVAELLGDFASTRHDRT